MAGSSKKREPKVRLSRSQIDARQVRMARAALGLTIAEFGTLVGLSANTISNIEHAHVTLSRTVEGLKEALTSNVPAIEWLPDTGESIGIRLHYGQLTEAFEPAPRVYGLKQGRGVHRHDPDELKRGMIGSDYPLEKLMKNNSDHEKRYGRDKRIGKRSNTETDIKVPDASSFTSPMSVVILKAAAEDRIAHGENPIRVWREFHNMSLTTLAKEVRITKGFLSQIETGKRKTPSKVQYRIARKLGIRPEEVIATTVPENKPAPLPEALASVKSVKHGSAALMSHTNALGIPASPAGPETIANSSATPPNSPSGSASLNIQRLEDMARHEGISLEQLLDGMGQFYREKNAEMPERKPRRR